MYRRGAPREGKENSAGAVTHTPRVEVVSCKRFVRDLQSGVIPADQAWVGLLTGSTGTCSAVAESDMDRAPSTDT